MPFPTVLENETYYSYSRYLHGIFGGKTYKIVVSSGLTCPTRDGSLAKKGCAFCDVRGSSSYFGKKGRGQSVTEQIRARLPAIRTRFGASHFLAYFQSYTNTYTSAEELRTLYEAALAEPEISGLCIGTRPDCLPDPILDLLEELAQKTYVSLELGVQSLEDATLQWLARGHDSAATHDVLTRLQKRAPHVHICVHLMFGSPTDSQNMAHETATFLSQTHIHGVKLHQLMILEHTELAQRWKEHPFPVLSIEEYAAHVATFIEALSPHIYLERLCATATHSQECLAPQWSRNRWEPHNQLRAFLREKNCIQGRQWNAKIRDLHLL